MKKLEISGYVVLFLGIILLAFTFINTYLFFQRVLSISASGDLMSAFGEVLAPLVETCIHAIYLGIMGWIGSIVTRRGVQILVTPRDTLPEADVEVQPETAEIIDDEIEETVEQTQAKTTSSDKGSG